MGKLIQPKAVQFFKWVLDHTSVGGIYGHPNTGSIYQKIDENKIMHIKGGKQWQVKRDAVHMEAAGYTVILNNNQKKAA